MGLCLYIFCLGELSLHLSGWLFVIFSKPTLETSLSNTYTTLYIFFAFKISIFLFYLHYMLLPFFWVFFICIIFLAFISQKRISRMGEHLKLFTYKYYLLFFHSQKNKTCFFRIFFSKREQLLS